MAELRVQDRPVQIVQRGTWKFTSEAFVELAGTIIKAVRDFWADHEFPYFLITLIPINEGGSKGGTGLTDSFEAFVSSDIESVGDLKFLLTHELFHTWNGRKILRQEPEELVYWFSEGFTDYFTRRILLRAGLITAEEYLTDVNRTIRDYYLSPAIRATNGDILKFTHTDPQIERMPYLRGDLLAIRWNAAIEKSSSHSLDDVMRDLLSSALRSRAVVSAETVDAHVKKYLRTGVRRDIEEYVDKGQIIIPGDADLGPCFELKNETFHKFDLGFQYKKSETGTGWEVTAVDPAGPAFKLGLRAGDVIISRSIYWNQIDKLSRLKFKKPNGDVKTVEYLPRT